MNRIREQRMAKKVSQLKMAMDLNISQAAISKYELGKSEPNLIMLSRIAEYFGVTTDYIMGRTDKKDICLSAGEQNFIETYRSLDQINQGKLSSYAEGLKAQKDK